MREPILDVRLGADGQAGVGVRHHAWASRAPGGAMRAPPRLSRLDPAGRIVGERELVAVTLDGDGRVIEEFGYPPSHRVHSCSIGDDGRIRGASRFRPDGTGRLNVPIRPGAKFVVLLRDEIVGDPGAPGVRRRRRTGLRTISLSDAGEVVRLPGSPFPDVPVLPPLDPLRLPTRPDRRVAAVGATARGPGGRVDSVKTYAPTTTANSYFEVVIVGDGYDKDQLDDFKSDAWAIRDRLRSIAPFSTHKDEVRYHRIVTVSNEYGLSDWRGGPKKDTYLRVRADHTPDVDAGFFVLDEPELLQTAIEAIPLNASEVDLFIIVVNALVNTACAYHEERLVIVARGAGVDDEELGDLVLHEIGHAVSDLAEERVTCVGMKPGETHKNFATAFGQEHDRVPWYDLAKASEKDGAGKFIAVHDWGMPTLYEDLRLDPVLPDPDDFGKLGLFWGCLCTEPEGDALSCAIDDEAGKGFYRPMARCRMRDLRDSYCRVCKAALSEAIHAAYEPSPPVTP